MCVGVFVPSILDTSRHLSFPYLRCVFCICDLSFCCSCGSDHQNSSSGAWSTGLRWARLRAPLPVGGRELVRCELQSLPCFSPIRCRAHILLGIAGCPTLGCCSRTPFLKVGWACSHPRALLVGLYGYPGCRYSLLAWDRCRGDVLQNLLPSHIARILLLLYHGSVSMLKTSQPTLIRLDPRPLGDSENQNTH